MGEESESVLRRRRSSANPNLALNLEVGYQVNEGGPSHGTPSPSNFRMVNADGREGPSSALLEFRKKQQSFDVQEALQIEECEEEELVIDSDGEGEGEEAAGGVDRAVTPTPIQDFAANTVYTEGPQSTDFLKVKQLEQDCITDVSDAGSEEEE